MKTLPPLRTRWLAPALALLLAACGEQALYSKLSERQANEMVAALRSAGIPADKQVRDNEYAVTTSSEHFSQAVQTLNALGLPREQFDTLGKVFKREGFVSSPLEERSRLIHALSQELSHTVSSIDGVVLARVSLVVPEKHPLQDKVVPSAASVFIKHRPGLDVETLVPKIKALMVNSVEGLPYESVSVVPFAAEAWNLPAQAATPATAALQAPLLAAGGVGLAALATAGGLWWRRRRGDAAAGAPRLGGPGPAPEPSSAPVQPLRPLQGPEAAPITLSGGLPADTEHSMRP